MSSQAGCDSCTNAPWEMKGIVNPDLPPGRYTVYIHDDRYTDTFIRRVPCVEHDTRQYRREG